MTGHALNVEAYLKRIGYSGERTATLATLRQLQLRHTDAIAFENITPLQKQPVRLDIASLEQKLVRDGRGGYCYEHNLLFSAVLETLGFAVVPLAARVHWDGGMSPRTHMLLRVNLEEGPHLADVGFGGQTPTGPIQLVPHVEQSTPHETFRLTPVGDEFDLETNIRGAWRPVYRFDLQQQTLVDYEVYNWYISTHPQSTFVNELLAARPHSGGRYALRNGDFASHTRDGETHRRTLTNVRELREVLEGAFLVRLPDDPEVDDVLQRVLDGNRRPAEAVEQSEPV